RDGERRPADDRRDAAHRDGPAPVDPGRPGARAGPALVLRHLLPAHRGRRRSEGERQRRPDRQGSQYAPVPFLPGGAHQRGPPRPRPARPDRPERRQRDLAGDRLGRRDRVAAGGNVPAGSWCHRHARADRARRRGGAHPVASGQGDAPGRGAPGPRDGRGAGSLGTSGSAPCAGGSAATARIVKECPSIRMVALTMHSSEEYVYSLLKAGARGYLLKESVSSDLVEAIHAVVGGGTYLHPSISTKVVDGYLKRPHPRTRTGMLDVLTPREREILQLIAEGHTNTATA